MTKQKKSTENDEKVIKLSTLIYSILTLVIVAFAVVCVMAYGLRSSFGEKAALTLSRVMPLPAAFVGWNHAVFLSDVQNNLNSIEKLYKSQNLSAQGLNLDLNTADGSKNLKIKEREILDKLVEDQAIMILAKKRGIGFSQNEIDSAVNEKLNELGTAQDVTAQLMSNYGWTLDDFKQKVVTPAMYQAALAQSFQAEDKSGEQAKSNIEKAKGELDAGKDFAAVVQEFSRGASKEKGGELGWVTKDQVIPEMQQALFGADAYQPHTIIESSIGWHIVDVENKKKENGQYVLQLRQVFIPKKTFADWLGDQMRQMQISVPLGDFVWDKDKAMVDFRDAGMRQYEKDTRAKLKGGAAIML
ncbi:MAG TPA: peptidylprolyl isomerase [Patescibacteria group bacterium]